MLKDQLDLAGAQFQGKLDEFSKNRKSLQANLKFEGLDPNAKELPPSSFRDKLAKEAEEIKRSLVDMDRREAKVEAAIPERLAGSEMASSLSKFRQARAEAEQLGLVEPARKA